MRECPGRIGPGAQGPIGPSRSWISLNSFKLEIGFLDKGEFKSFKLEIGFLDKGEFKLFKLEIGLEEGQGLPPPLYIEGGCAPSPHTHLPPSPSSLATFLSPSRLFVGEALQQKFSTIYTTPSCCRSNLSLHHTCWSEEGGDVEVLHVCISRRHRHLWC